MIKGFLIALVVIVFGGAFFVMPKMVGKIVRENKEQKQERSDGAEGDK